MSANPIAFARRIPYFLALLVMLGCSQGAIAGPWSPGQYLTYTQDDWSSGGAATLDFNFTTVYPSSVMFVGSIAGFVMIFDNSADLENFMPSSGPSAPLDATLLDPAASSSGYFGGEVLALQLDVDFSDAGILPSPSGVHFGDLVVENYYPAPQVDGLTVREILAYANADLSGGTSPLILETEASDLVGSLTYSFDEGIPATFAQEFLVLPGAGDGGGGISVEEPATPLLLGVGLLVMGVLRRRGRCPLISDTPGGLAA